MKIFGKIQELYELIFRKDNRELTLRPNQSTTYTAARDFQFPPGDSDQVLTSASSTQTLTGKTIDGDDNTLQDVGLTSLKTVLGDANKVIRRNASGVVVSDNSIPNSDPLLTTTATQTFSNKTIDGDDNTVQDLPITSLKTVLGDANKVLRRDTSGIPQSGNLLPNSSEILTTDSTSTLTNKTFDADGTGNNLSNIDNGNIKTGAAIDATKIYNGLVTNTAFGYLEGVTSSIQTQFGTKVTGPASSVDNTLPRFDLTTGKLLQTSSVVVSDTDAVSGVTQLDVDNLRLDGNTLSSTNSNGNLILDPNGTGLVSAPAPLDVSGTSSYIKFPSLTTTQRDALTPADGMQIFNTTNNQVEVYYSATWNSAAAVPEASPSQTGTVNTGTQSFGGVKSFENRILFNNGEAEVTTLSASACGFHASSSGGTNIQITRAATTANAPALFFAKANGSTAVPTISAAGDNVLRISGYAHDGTQFSEVASIVGELTHTPYSGVAPGRLNFNIALPVTGTLTEVMNVSSLLSKKSPVVVTTDSPASPCTFTSTAHGLTANQIVRLTTTGTLPSPLAISTDYYVRNPTTDTFELATAPNGTSINTTDAGSGIHSYIHQQYGTSLTVADRLVIGGSATTTLTHENKGLELRGGAMNATTKYTPLIKFTTADTDITENNARMIAYIGAVTDSTINSNTTPHGNIDFATLPFGAASTDLPTVRMQIRDDGYVTFTSGINLGDGGTLVLKDTDTSTGADERIGSLLIEASDASNTSLVGARYEARSLVSGGETSGFRISASLSGTETTLLESNSTGALVASNLAGTGTRMVTADTNGALSASAIFEDSGEQDATLSWNSTAPTSPVYEKYRWYRIGNLVTLTISANYAVAGATNTSVYFEFPSGMPAPVIPTGANTTEYILPGFGYWHTADGNLTSASSKVGLYYAAANTFRLFCVRASGSAAFATFGITYVTTGSDIP